MREGAFAPPMPDPAFLTPWRVLALVMVFLTVVCAGLFWLLLAG